MNTLRVFHQMKQMISQKKNLMNILKVSINNKSDEKWKVERAAILIAVRQSVSTTRILINLKIKLEFCSEIQIRLINTISNLPKILPILVKENHQNKMKFLASWECLLKQALS